MRAENEMQITLRTLRNSFGVDERCCVNRFLVELPQTPDAAMPRPASEGGPVQ